MSMGKPSGPIEYNGQTVKPEDAGYAEASDALVASTKKFDEAKQRSREARTNMAGSRSTGATPKSSPSTAQTTSSAPTTGSTPTAPTASAPTESRGVTVSPKSVQPSSTSAGPNEQGVKPSVLAKKAQLESTIGKKLVVTSGFRAGAANHGTGDAIDLGFGANKLTEDEKNKILKSAIELGFTGIGAEYRAPGGAHIHLDTSHPSLVGWGSDYTSKSLGSDSPYAQALITARLQGKPLPDQATQGPVYGANGFSGILSGPSSGYRPDITMHGREQLTITPTDLGKRNSFEGPDATTLMSQQLSKMDQLVEAFNNTGTQDMMIMQLTKLDELVRVMQNQVGVSTKILQQSR
jgi:hypothetical protein